jgi:GGDEF domain-containing protein
MGGDEFVIVAPGLSASAAEARGICLSELANAAGREICGVEWLSLSVGCAIYPEDGVDAEKLLAEADRRMYIQKQEHHKILKVFNAVAEARRPNGGVRDAVAG